MAREEGTRVLGIDNTSLKSSLAVGVELVSDNSEEEEEEEASPVTVVAAAVEVAVDTELSPTSTTFTSAAAEAEAIAAVAAALAEAGAVSKPVRAEVESAGDSIADNGALLLTPGAASTSDTLLAS